jgi:hypothetical protein
VECWDADLDGSRISGIRGFDLAHVGGTLVTIPRPPT